MGLLDIFRRRPDPPRDTTIDEWKARGKLEADVETLKLQWSMYKADLQRLVARLEKRDQRAAERQQKAAEQQAGEPDDFDEVAGYRAIRERRNALLRSR